MLQNECLVKQMGFNESLFDTEKDIGSEFREDESSMARSGKNNELDSPSNDVATIADLVASQRYIFSMFDMREQLFCMSVDLVVLLGATRYQNEWKEFVRLHVFGSKYRGEANTAIS